MARKRRPEENAHEMSPEETPLAELENYGLTQRSVNALEGAGLILVGDVLTTTREFLEAQARLGDATIEELRKVLRRRFSLKTPNLKKIVKEKPAPENPRIKRLRASLDEDGASWFDW